MCFMASSLLTRLPDQVAVAYSVLEFQRQPEHASVDSFIWDVHNPSQPEATLSPSSQLVCINFNPKDHKVRTPVSSWPSLAPMSVFSEQCALIVLGAQEALRCRWKVKLWHGAPSL
jgi:hypothetical protein